MAEILILEDDPVFGEILQMHLEDSGHTPVLVQSIQDARAQLAHTEPDALLLDHHLPDGFGLDFLREVRAEPSSTPVIMITGMSDNSLAIEAMRLGAFDFIRKPMDVVELDVTLSNALSKHRLTRQVNAISADAGHAIELNQVVGSSPAILEICKTIGAVATRTAPILVTGESGTGKEVIARAIHHHACRKGPFLAVNCAALAEGLLESELFGHEKGSFTGASGRKEGRFELAAGGTLFLDEVGEMPLSLQTKLLRVLQEGTFERLGGTRTLKSDARIVAATNRDLPRLIQEGTFREDLFYRLNVVQMHLPPLRDRMQDMPALTEHLIKKINERQHTAIKHLADKTWRNMKEYHWPGNVRELENLLTRAAVLARGDTITPDLLAFPSRAAPTGDEYRVQPESVPPLVTLEQLEQEHIRKVLSHVKWHKGKACEILGISRPALERKIVKYAID